MYVLVAFSDTNIMEKLSDRSVAGGAVLADLGTSDQIVTVRARYRWRSRFEHQHNS